MHEPHTLNTSSRHKLCIYGGHYHSFDFSVPLNSKRAKGREREKKTTTPIAELLLLSVFWMSMPQALCDCCCYTLHRNFDIAVLCQYIQVTQQNKQEPTNERTKVQWTNVYSYEMRIDSTKTYTIEKHIYKPKCCW